MGESSYVFLWVVGIVFGTFWATLCTVGFYFVGRWLAPAFSRGWRRKSVFYFIGFFAGLPSVLPFLLDVPLWLKVSVAILAWLWQFWAVASGFWSGLDRLEHQSHRDFRLRTEEWLAEWESPALLEVEPESPE